MKILMAGDVVGSPGRIAFARLAGAMKSAGKADFIVVNGENAAGGKGITAALAAELLEAGADVVTLGDHTWDQKDVERALDREPRILRPANFPAGCPGRGFVTVDSPRGSVTVMNLVGRVFMSRHDDSPFAAADAILKKEPNLSRTVLVDFHAEATSEKAALARYLDGRVTAVVGSHTHVQTSDERILAKGTAFISDMGMTGPVDSIIGCDERSVLSVFLTGMRSRFEVADKGDAAVEGVLLDVNEETGKARAIKRIRE